MDAVDDSLCEMERDLADLKADLLREHPSDPKAAAFIEWIEQGERHKERERIRLAVLACENVEGVHDLRTRYAGDRTFVDFRLEVDGRFTVEKGQSFVLFFKKEPLYSLRLPASSRRTINLPGRIARIGRRQLNIDRPQLRRLPRGAPTVFVRQIVPVSPWLPRH
jgi:hypothetical protein